MVNLQFVWIFIIYLTQKLKHGGDRFTKTMMVKIGGFQVHVFEKLCEKIQEKYFLEILCLQGFNVLWISIPSDKKPGTR